MWVRKRETLSIRPPRLFATQTTPAIVPPEQQTYTFETACINSNKISMSQKFRIRLDDGTGAVSNWYTEAEFGEFLSAFIARRSRPGKHYTETPSFTVQLSGTNDPLL